MPDPLHSVTEVYAKVAKDREGLPSLIPPLPTKEQAAVIQEAIRSGASQLN